jgi:hypothetical protein
MLSAQTPHPHPQAPAWEYPLTRALTMMALDFEALEPDAQAFVAGVLDLAVACFGEPEGEAAS